MATKKMKVYYYYPIVKTTNLLGEEEIKVVGIEKILEVLKDKDVRERVVGTTEDNIQLKRIKKNTDDRWELGFLKNTKDTYFKSKLDEVDIEAEPLEDDEFIGQECCMIYDEENRVVAVQNNIKSISYLSLAAFFKAFTGESLQFIPLTLKEKYNDISDEIGIDYRSIVLNFVDIDEINRIATEENIDSVMSLAKISNNLSAVTGKIELGVARNKMKFLKKDSLKEVVKFFKKHPSLTKGLKVKVFENDTIRMIDLIENKVYDDISISITKEDPKTFDKILNPMNDHLDTVLKEDLEKCKALTRGEYIDYREVVTV